MLTKNEILNKTDIDSGRTLIRWHQAGLIPPPEVSPGPDGRGRTGRWPDWVLPRCKRIRRLIKAGKSLEEIKQLLGTDWKREDESYRALKENPSRYVLSEVAVRMDYEAAVNAFIDLVWAKIEPFFVSRKADIRIVLKQLTDTLPRRETIEKILGLVRDGFNPVLVLADDIHIVPDFLVGQILAEGHQDGTPFVVYPLLAEFTKAMDSVFEDLPPEPKFSPVASIASKARDEYEVHRIGSHDFELTPRMRRKKK